MEATATCQREEQLAALYAHNYRLFWRLDEAEQALDYIKQQIRRRSTPNLKIEQTAATATQIQAQEQFNSSTEIITYFLGKIPDKERMVIRARCMARIPYKSDACQPYFIRRQHQQNRRHH